MENVEKPAPFRLRFADQLITPIKFKKLLSPDKRVPRF